MKAAPGFPRQLQGLARNRFMRFLAVGVVNTLFGYACFAALLWAGLHYSLALLVATVAGVLFNFRTIGGFVFGSSHPRLLGRFIGVYGAVYGANVAGIALLQRAGIGAFEAQALLALPAAVVSFLLNRRFVFAHG